MDCGREPGLILATGAISLHEIAAVALRHVFWYLRPEPTINQCRIFSGSRRYRKVETTAELANIQASLLIHQFPHLCNAHDPPNGFTEAYSVQDVVNLDSTEAFKRAANYAYNVSGTSQSRTVGSSPLADMFQPFKLDIQGSLRA